MSKESAYFILDDISGSHGAKELKRELGRFPGVLSVSVNAEKNSLAVDFDSTGVDAGRLKRHVEKLGYNAELEKNEEHIM